MIHQSILMNEDIRQKLISNFNKQIFYCPTHPEQIANLVITDSAPESQGLVCATCVGDMQKVENQQQQSPSTPLKYAVTQIHQSCNTLISALPTCAFVDHHINLIRMLARNNCKSFQTVLQASISNFFQKTYHLLNGRYFQQFYSIISQLNDLSRNSKNIKMQNKKTLLKRLVDYICCFVELCSQYEGYCNLSSEDKVSGQSIILQIKKDVSSIYKEMKEKALVHHKSTIDQQNILQLFNPTLQHSKHYRFSSTLLHHSIKVVDSKKIQIIDLTDNEFTLIALVEPMIGKKKTIKFKMEGIKGWVALGIAIKSIVEQNCFKFQSDHQHGTFQASYDGYSWNDDSATNQQYNSWSYNEGDTVTLTVNPSTNELTYIRNDQYQTPLILKYSKQKNDKLYFCVSLNYNQDSVRIIE